jgi:hypothetical protein
MGVTQQAIVSWETARLCGIEHSANPSLHCSIYCPCSMIGRDQPMFCVSLSVNWLAGLGMNPTGRCLSCVKRGNAEVWCTPTWIKK